MVQPPPGLGMYAYMVSTLEARRVRARRLARSRRIGAWLLATVALLMFSIGFPWMVWRAPYILDAQYIDEKTVGEGTGSAALVTGLRTALVACVAALGAGIALLYTARTYRLTRRGQVTERFTKALERLGSDKIYVRIGGILALEQIVQDAPEQATDAARVLGQFLRDEARVRGGSTTDDGSDNRAEEPTKPLAGKLAADLQAALTALTRPESRTHVDPREPLDLRGLHLAGANLSGADLTGADLSQATLTNAKLAESTLTDANLSGANLTEAKLIDATLTGANLVEAMLIRADLWGARFTDANLLRATLADADLSEATLTKAALNGATLTGSDLSAADLSEATLAGADLSGATLTDAHGLSQRQIGTAKVDSTTVLPSHVSVAAPPPPTGPDNSSK